MHNRVATIYAILSDTYAVYIGTYDHAYMVPGMDNVRIKFLTDDHKTTNPRTLSWCIATGSCGFGTPYWRRCISTAKCIYTSYLDDE